MLVGLVYKSVWIVVPSRMAVISRKFTRSSEHSAVNFIIGWKRLISCMNYYSVSQPCFQMVKMSSKDRHRRKVGELS